MNEEEDLIRISNAEMMGRVAERERIIKLLEAKKTNDGKTIFLEVDGLIAAIKGEQKSQSEHLTDAIQATVFAYEEGEQK